ncbi:MAG: PQQ-binding-like beta-propeller repeat protein [Planctomycetota bacterium]
MATWIKTALVGAAVLLLAPLVASCKGGPQSASHSTPKQNFVPSGKAAQLAPELLEQRGFVELWTHSLGSAIEQIWIVSGNLYLTSQASNGSFTLLKVNGENGRTEWTYSLAGKLVFPPTVYNYPKELQATRFNELFIVENDNIVVIDDRHGDKVGNMRCGFSISTPVTAGVDNVFVGSWNGRVYAFSKANGLEQWTYITDESVVAAGETGKLNVFFGSEDGSVYSFNQGAGYVEGSSWRVPTGGKIIAQPVFYNDRVYIGSWDFKLYCLEDFRGLVRWSFPCGSPIVSPVFPFKDVVIAIGQAERRGSVLPDYTLMVFSDDSGALRWERTGFTRVIAADALHCYALDTSGALTALRMEDGKTAWQMPEVKKADYILSQSADYSANRELWGRIYLASHDGMIQAIRPKR